MGPNSAMIESTDILPSPTLAAGPGPGDSVRKVSGAATVAEEGRGLADTKASNSEFKPRRSAEELLAGGGWLGVRAGPEERERPSRSESRLLEVTAWAALGAGAGLGLVSSVDDEMRK